MEDIQFGKLQTCLLRDAWKNEALNFTPWLSENLDHLSEVIGMPLELTDTEVAVDRFSADILARNPEDGSSVLIENQLEVTDHKHLGQIMTYLAGLEAKTVIWVAPDFREPHRTAIRWLNEHTTDDFSFFAVRLSIVRIGDSPFAPILDVVEKPDEFERSIQRKVNSGSTKHYELKEEFWKAFLTKYPETRDMGVREGRYPSNYINAHINPNVEISIWIGSRSCGVYVRSAWGESSSPLLELFSPYKEQLEITLGAPIGPNARNHFFSQRMQLGHDNTDDWQEMMSWLRKKIDLYQNTLIEMLP
ncbi:hypothetical protein [Thalassospira lucentensis]|uniref:hypothetical protein n=1 Tax=Thalassospira lucentensis TaxID=168935 RepID=UPI00399D79B4